MRLLAVVLGLLSIPVVVMHVDWLSMRHAMRSRDKRLSASYEKIDAAIGTYYRHSGHLPPRLSDIAGTPGNEGFSEPADPAGYRFNYRVDGGCYRVWSDGYPGTPDADSGWQVCRFSE